MEIEKDESNEGATETKENGFHLYPVPAYSSGEGLPYAPVDWPQPGDKWRWKVGRRIAASGHFLDRYLYLPKRLQSITKGRNFASKQSVEQYIRTISGADVEEFFTSFSWKIPSMNRSKVKGTENGLLSLPSWETTERSGSELKAGVRCCKAGNTICGSLVTSEEPSSGTMFCDLCCSEPDFCRDCCCILCSKTIDPSYGGYSFIKCEVAADDGVICGHIAHIDCSLKSYMAGVVGGSIDLDVEYYCRRCDARTDLHSHVSKLLQTCESINSNDEIEKILNLGARILRGSQRTSAERMLHKIKTTMGKLKSGTCLEDVWKVEGSTPITPEMVTHIGNDASESAKFEEPVGIRPVSPSNVSTNFDPQLESLKLDNEIECILGELRKSQELEYSIAEECLNEQKRHIQNLYHQLHKEKCDLARHAAYLADPDALFELVVDRVDQVKREVLKLKDMEEVAKGFGNASKEILKEHFGFDM